MSPYRLNRLSRYSLGTQRDLANSEAPWPDAMAALEWLSPPEPGGNKDDLPEPKVHAAKLLGQRLMSRDFDRRVAEVKIRVAVLNCFTALGISVTVAAG
jgi:hypothetical protein